MAIAGRFEDLPCAGPTDAGAEPCPQRKTVRKHKQARGPLRCPDCHLENKRRMVRRRLPALRQEQSELQRRIEHSAPPASTLDGQIQRRVRDVKRDEPELEEDDVFDEDEDDDEIEPDPDAEVAEEVLRPRASRLQDPKLRQVNESRSTTGGPSWWVDKDDAGFTASAHARAEELKTSPAAAKLRTPVNFDQVR